MTTPEDRDLWERDEEALRAPAPVDPMGSEAARVARYAEALTLDWHDATCIEGAECGYREMHAQSNSWPALMVKAVEQGAVVAVADEEHAALVAEVERLRASLVELAPSDEVEVEGSFFQRADLPRVLGNFMRTAAEYGREAKTAAVERDQLRQTVTRLNRRAQIAEAAIHELTHGTGQGKARAVAAEMWERCQSAHEQGCERAQAAEAKVAKVEALADEWDALPMPHPSDHDGTRRIAVVSGKREAAHALRAALADAPAEQRAEGGA